MTRRRESITPLTEIQVLAREIRNLKRQLETMKQPGATTVHAIDKKFYITPVQGETEWNYPNARAYIWHDDNWWPLMPPTLYIKLQKDTEETVPGDDNFKFVIGRDMDLHYLIDAEAYITTGGSITINLENNTQSQSMLSAPLIVNSGMKNTKESTPKRTITVHQVDWGDEIEVIVSSVGGSAMGAGVMLTFSAEPLKRDLDA